MSMMGHPLVIETGETFLTDAELLRFIRIKCGDAVADYLITRIDTDEMPIVGWNFIRKLKDALDSLDTEIDDVVDEIRNVTRLIESGKGMNG